MLENVLVSCFKFLIALWMSTLVMNVFFVFEEWTNAIGKKGGSL